MVNGGILQSAMELIKEKERQGDKAMDRLHDGFNKQIEATANARSWTGEQRPAQPATTVVKEKVVEKGKVPKPETTSTTTPETPSEDKDDDVPGKGLFDIASGAN